VQVAPFRVKAVGAASLLVQVPWNPTVVLPPAVGAGLVRADLRRGLGDTGHDRRRGGGEDQGDDAE
jgi:hypothetical protein